MELYFTKFVDFNRQQYTLHQQSCCLFHLSFVEKQREAKLKTGLIINNYIGLFQFMQILICAKFL